MKSAILAAVLSAWTGLGVAADATRAKAFIGARVCDGAGNVIERATIVVRDGRIQQVGPADRIQVPAGAEGSHLHARSLACRNCSPRQPWRTKRSNTRACAAQSKS
jgi:hypothetical protein